jgi:Polyketide cyclase / dehydrase and lipid transport
VKTLCAEGTVASTPEEVYAFLARLENHWRLNDEYLRMESLRPDRRGATVSLRGPAGLRRTALTEVTTAHAPHRFGGTVTTTTRTRAGAWWTIEPNPSGARVSLSAAIAPRGFVDRVLLALGGRWWLERRCERVVARLGVALAQ